MGYFLRGRFCSIGFFRGGGPDSDSDDQGMRSVNALKQSAFPYKSVAFPDVSIGQMEWCHTDASSLAKVPVIVKLLQSWKLCTCFLKYLHYIESTSTSQLW